MVVVVSVIMVAMAAMLNLVRGVAVPMLVTMVFIVTVAPVVLRLRHPPPPCPRANRSARVAHATGEDAP